MTHRNISLHPAKPLRHFAPFHRVATNPQGSAGPVRHELRSIAGSTVASRFQCWVGASGRRYTVSVFAFDPSSPDHGLPDFDGCVVVGIRPDGTAAGVLRVEDVFDLRALRAGGTVAGIAEWHVHLLAEDRASREAAVDDLRGPLGRSENGAAAPSPAAWRAEAA